ncbi:hypothetical protein C8R44DRAFT_726143 [Mycena epipterygia]|nr:hypothetical protein C8R44DRAFT_726143 [Mycena epipterygia]
METVPGGWHSRISVHATRPETLPFNNLLDDVQQNSPYLEDRFHLYGSRDQPGKRTHVDDGQTSPSHPENTMDILVICNFIHGDSFPMPRLAQVVSIAMQMFLVYSQFLPDPQLLDPPPPTPDQPVLPQLPPLPLLPDPRPSSPVLPDPPPNPPPNNPVCNIGNCTDMYGSNGPEIVTFCCLVVQGNRLLVTTTVARLRNGHQRIFKLYEEVLNNGGIEYL